MEREGSEAKIAGLQALRGIAAFLVFWQHLFHQASALTPGPVEAFDRLGLGSMGVLVFFAISGFLMAEKASDPPAKFLLDRVRRIFPTFWLSLLTIGVLGWTSLGGVRVPWQLVLLIPAGPWPEVPSPYWTLYFEMLFYVGVFLAISCSPSLALPTVLVWAALGLALRTFPPESSYVYGSPRGFDIFFQHYVLFFLAGMLARRLGGGRRAWRSTYALAAVVLLFLADEIADLLSPAGLGAKLQSDARQLLAATGAFCAVNAAVLWPAQGRASRLLRWLGDVSYGFYLIHIAVLVLGVQVLMRVGRPASFLANLAILFVWGVVLSAAFGRLDLPLQTRLKGLQARFFGDAASGQKLAA